MIECHIEDAQRIAFAEGEDDTIDAHVMECDRCQAFLAELWEGDLQTDLTEPVMKAIGLEELVIEIVRLGGDILARYGRAAKTYGTGIESDE